MFFCIFGCFHYYLFERIEFNIQTLFTDLGFFLFFLLVFLFLPYDIYINWLITHRSILIAYRHFRPLFHLLNANEQNPQIWYHRLWNRHLCSWNVWKFEIINWLKVNEKMSFHAKHFSYPSNWIRLPVVVAWLLAFSLSSSLFWVDLPGDRSVIGFGSSSSGFGCIKINGSSATRSL